METYSPDEAIVMFEARLARDEGKVSQSVGLRAAQIKYLVRRLVELTSDPAVGAALERLLPPMSPNELIPYARDAHGLFEREIVPLVQRKIPREESAPLVMELEEVLIEIRRLVVQNLSKHPVIKPFRLLSEWDQAREERAQLDAQAEQNRLLQAAQEQKWNVARETIRALQNEPGADTFFRLEESRNTLLEQKKALLDEWMRMWRELEPVFVQLGEKTKTFEKMENAQLRVLQLYLANPSSARTKDTHGAGLLMLLRLAVEALEQKKSGLLKADRNAARETLLRALDSAFLAQYYSYIHELEATLEKNQQEYFSHPLYARRGEWELKEREALRTWHALNEEAEMLSRSRAENGSRMEKIQREIDDACRLNGTFRIEWD